MTRKLTSLLLLVTGGILTADEWNPEDDTFDPKIQSVLIGDSTWIGDPSPFTHRASARTGYTHVHTTSYDGIGPAVQVSLMIPLAPGETEAPGGGMFLLNTIHVEQLIKAADQLADSKFEESTKPISIMTAMKDANWSLSGITEQETRFVQFENKIGDKNREYRFSINACKKLLGAIKHSLRKLNAESNKPQEGNKP